MTFIKNFAGLLKKRRGYHFLNSADLIRYFIQEHYPDNCVVCILECQKAFESVSRLNILKRDDYSSYLLGLVNEFVIIEFEDLSMAQDYVYAFPIELKLKFLIFDHGKLIRTEKGLLK